MVARKESSSLLRTVRAVYVGRASVFREKNVYPHGQVGPISYIFARKEVPPYYAPKNEYHLLAGTHHSGWLTCGPTKLTRTEGFFNLVNMHDSSSSDHTMSIQRP